MSGNTTSPNAPIEDLHFAAPIPDNITDSFAPIAYIERRVSVSLMLGVGAFGEGGEDTVTFRNHRVSATIVKANDEQITASATIYGLPFPLVKKVSTYGSEYAGGQRRNGILIQAGNDVAGLEDVFSGGIINAYFDGQSQPNVSLHIDAADGSFENIKPAPVITVAGAVDVATVMQSLADQMKLKFENNGINIKMRDIYYPGTAMVQMRRLADHAGINATVDNGVLAIWPRYGSRGKGKIPLITPLSGLKGYPTFDSFGIVATFLFRNIKAGQTFQVQSSVFQDELEDYLVATYTHSLESEAPDGQWFTTVHGIKLPTAASPSLRGGEGGEGQPVA